MSVDDEDEKRLGKSPTFKELFLATHLVKESKKKFWDGLYDESLDEAVFCTNRSRKAYEEYATAMLEKYGEDVTQHSVRDLQSQVEELHNRVEDVQQQIREEMKEEMQRQITELMNKFGNPGNTT
ncbi:hypothetical protein E3N88_05051 [Mikania micrantha]|uniref:Uncharacterized protein n=1 Tax=Mikania micrantha TaxID=192012 RepID=A0A5N6PX29_9ASTR|nr:hypothetical protein E3N88_05051 [Mikania micrantha]